MQSPNNEIYLVHEVIAQRVSNHYPTLKSLEFDAQLSSKIELWESTTLEYLKISRPFEKNRLALVSAERDFRAHGGCKDSIYSDLAEYKLFNPNALTKFWEHKIIALEAPKKDKSNKKQNELDAIRRNEQEAWRKDYEKQLLEWQLNEIELRRLAFLEELDEWFKALGQLQEIFQLLGIEPGVLWDTSAGNLSQQDISFLKSWCEYLQKDEGVRQLCDLMGRLNKESQSHRTEIIDSTFQYSVSIPDIHANEEIVGIELGRDLENVIPQELALLSDPDVSILFDLKYVENRLMCFSKQGYNTETREENIQEEMMVAEDDKLGPIIICVDTSGSMSGAPENIAKALTLALATRAVSQDRKCYLINFSTTIETLYLTPPKGISYLIEFLKMSFHGGTDVAPALYEGLRMMSNAEYKNSDLLVISDFVLDGISADIVTLCKAQRADKNRFFSLSIGTFCLGRVTDDFFDENWIYDPKVGGISALNNTIEIMFSKR